MELTLRMIAYTEKLFVNLHLSRERYERLARINDYLCWRFYRDEVDSID